MITKPAAQTLLKQWGRYQNREISRIDFPPVSPMFRDYVAGYRSTSDRVDEDDLAEKVGLALSMMQSAMANALRRYYMDGGKVTRRVHDMALVGFQRSWEALE